MVSSGRANNHDGEKVLRKDENRLLSKLAALHTSLNERGRQLRRPLNSELPLFSHGVVYILQCFGKTPLGKGFVQDWETGMNPYRCSGK